MGITLIENRCSYCGSSYSVYIGHYNRAKKKGLNQYCSKNCSGLGQRIDETPEEKKVYKQWYDLFIRESMSEDDKILRSLQSLVLFHLDYRSNPEKYREERQRRMADHIEYCRRPEYKNYKKGYDEQYRAKKYYGDFWEAAIVLKNLDKEIDYRESKRQNKIYNKSTTKRKRSWQNQLKQNVRILQQLI